MNEASFNICLKESKKFLKKIEFYKGGRDFDIGIYSEETLQVGNSGDYKLIYDTAINNFDYELLLMDDSIFQIQRLDNQKYRYAFIQSTNEYISFDAFLEELNIEPDEFNGDEKLRNFIEESYEQRKNEQKMNGGASYIRYDTDRMGYKPNIHSYSHFHFGLNNQIRIPCSLILTPVSFVLFVIKQIYPAKWGKALRNGTLSNLYNFKSYCTDVDKALWTNEEKRDLYIT
jgi:hypothetical protein